jgi:hypothetical protein
MRRAAHPFTISQDRASIAHTDRRVAASSSASMISAAPASAKDRATRPEPHAEHGAGPRNIAAEASLGWQRACRGNRSMVSFVDRLTKRLGIGLDFLR